MTLPLCPVVICYTSYNLSDHSCAMIRLYQFHVLDLLIVAVVQQVHSEVAVSKLPKDLAVVVCKAMSLEFQLLL
jgi:hypothetical protein